MRRIWFYYINYEIKKVSAEYDILSRYVYSIKFVQCRHKKSDKVRQFEVTPYAFWESLTRARNRFGLDADEISISNARFGVTIYYKNGPSIH